MLEATHEALRALVPFSLIKHPGGSSALMRYTPFIERAVASLAYFKDLDMAASVEDSGDDSY